MVLEEVLNFIHNLNEDDHREYIIPIGFAYDKLEHEVRETVVSNEDEFGIFLSCLYCLYRKIEMKMDKHGYPSILPDFNSNETSIVTLCVNLNNAKQDYKSMQRIDFLKMYPVLKRLFFSYIHYIKYSMDHVDIIDEANHLPGSVNEITRWLVQSNTWFPIKVKKKWFNCMESFIVVPDGFNQVIEILQETIKFDDAQVINDDEALQPYIGDEHNKDILFGFVDMEGADGNQSSKDSKLFESECPMECTPGLRRWVCSKCGEYVRSNLNSTGQQFLFCNCGSKKYRDRLFICTHTKFQTVNLDDLILSITQQLQKIKVKNEGNNDEKIQTAINCLSKKRSEEEIKSALKDLQSLPLNKRIQHLIYQYLNKNQ